MQTVIKYFKTARPSKLYTALLLLTSIASDVPYMFTPLVYGMIIKYMTELNFSMLLYMLILYFGLKAFSKLAFFLNYRYVKKYFRSIYRNLQNGLVDTVENLDVDWFGSENKSSILNVENYDLKQLCGFSGWLNDFTVYIISFIVSAVILVRTSIWLAVLGIVIDSIVVLLLGRFNKKYEKLIFASKAQTDKETSLFSQLINGIHEIKVFNIMPKLKRNYQAVNEEYLNYNDKIVNNARIRENLVPTITMTAEMIIMAFMTFCVFKRGFGVDTVVVVISYFGKLFSDLSSIVSSLGTLKVVNVSIDRYNNIVNLAERSGNRYGTVAENAKVGKIRFENVTFGYESENVLNDLSIEIEPNSMTALVGKSGSGKSTVFGLLTRIRRQRSGSITLDGTDIFDYTQDAYSENVSVVRQNPFVFSMSIYENLALINPDRDEITAVCKKVDLHDYIMSLPKGYDTVLSEDASDLSGGQKQRLAIARTLLKGAKVILCDEITSALDEKLSEDIFDLLEELKADHTIIVITHKPDEMARADKIIDLWEIKEQSLARSSAQ